jgi:tetratricopeptide (TPR) repeat protein
MKRLIISLLIIISGKALYAQHKEYHDLKFNKIIVFEEKQWVVMSEPDSAGFYPFGYVFVDPDEGLVFQKAGSLKINEKGKYVLNKAEVKKEFDREYIYRRTSWMVSGIRLIRVSLLPANHFKELKIKETEPDSIKRFYNYTDTLAYNYKKGCIYSDINWYDKGITYLEAIYKIDPHYAGVELRTDKFDVYFSQVGLELKLAYAYKRAGQMDKAITILNDAIANNPNNTSFYMQLGLVYDGKNEWNKAIDVYKRGLALITDEKSSQKWWFAGCISNMYGELKNDQERIKWRALSNGYNPCPGCVY